MKPTRSLSTFSTWLIALVAPIILQDRSDLVRWLTTMAAPGLLFWASGQNRSPTNVTNQFILAAITFSTISTFVAFRLAGSQLVFGLCLALGLSGAFRAGYTRSDQEIQSLLKSLVLVAQIASVIALIEWTRKAPLIVFTAYARPTPFRSSAFLGHPLVLSTFLGAVLVALLATAVSTRKRLAGTVGTLLLLSAGALTTLSRSIIVVLAGTACFLAYFLQRSRIRGRLKLAAVVTLFAMLGLFGSAKLLGPAFYDRLQDINAVSQAGRLENFRFVTDRLSLGTAFVGNGPNAVLYAIRRGERFVSTLTSLDNQYLTLLFDFGLLGLLALLAPLVTAVRSARARTAQTLPFLAMTVALSIGSAFFEVLYWPPLMLLFGLSLGASCRRSDPETV